MEEDMEEKLEEFREEKETKKGLRWRIRDAFEELRARWIVWVIWG